MSRRLLLPVILVLACTSVAGDDSPTDELAAAAPEWRALGLVIRNTDITWVDSAGAEHRIASRLSEGEEAWARAELENVPALFSAWSGGMGRMSLDLRVVDDTVTSMSNIGQDSFWVAPGDVAAVLDAHAPPGAFDSIFVMFDPDQDGAGGLPIHAYYGIGVSGGTRGATFGSLLVTGDQASDSPNRGEAHIHEWLHGSTAWYRDHGFPAPDPHENAHYGFPAADESGSWGAWYAALMQGNLLDPDTGAQHGITADTWLSETPRGARSTPTIRAAFMADADWLYLEWDPVPDVGHYTLFAVTTPDTFASRVEAGADDRGPFRYTYFHRSELCEGAVTPAGEHAIWVQIWAGDDPSRAATADAAGTILCP
ncbi:MAG TPA: hypothetical protein VFU21_21155 [Kofleriaceae bacterium]|nr:hypothetical protein [Kofleriaceae bacterium]